jgi:hypothetical protein
MEFRALAASDAAAVGRLAEERHPPELAQSEEDIAYALDLARRGGLNYSLGLFSPEGRLRAYLLAWVQPSLIQDRLESVVFLEDLYLPPSLERHFGDFLELLMEALHQDRREHLDWETVVDPEGLDLALDHFDLLAESGYHLDACAHLDGVVPGLPLTWLHFAAGEVVEDD